MLILLKDVKDVKQWLLESGRPLVKKGTRNVPSTAVVTSDVPVSFEIVKSKAWFLLQICVI